MKLAITLEDHFGKYASWHIKKNTIVVVQPQNQAPDKETAHVTILWAKRNRFTDTLPVPRNNLRFLTTDEKKLVKLLLL